MIHDHSELSRVGRTLNEALALLQRERERLQQQHGATPTGDNSAGSPMQTIYGLDLMSRGVRDALKYVALAAGYASLGLQERAGNAMELARMTPVGFPSGADRMARPLGEATVQALEMIRGIDGFFDESLDPKVELALSASQASYPPAD